MSSLACCGFSFGGLGMSEAFRYFFNGWLSLGPDRTVFSVPDFNSFDMLLSC
jgi:hypothetical protein